MTAFRLSRTWVPFQDALRTGPAASSLGRDALRASVGGHVCDMRPTSVSTSVSHLLGIVEDDVSHHQLILNHGTHKLLLQ